jgi:hypothetical protein
MFVMVVVRVSGGIIRCSQHLLPTCAWESPTNQHDERQGRDANRLQRTG